MRIENYLLNLDNQMYSRQGSDNIRIYGIGEIIKKIYDELKGQKSIREIETKIKTHQTFSNWILNKTGIAIQDLYRLCEYWKDVCKKTDREFEEMWAECYNKAGYFGCMNGKRIMLPKTLDHRLAYLLGVIFGDGHLADPNKSYDKLTSYNSELRITDQYRDTFVFLRKLFQELFDYVPKIYSEKSKIDKLFYRFVIKSKPLHRFFMTICGMPTGNKCGKLRVPNIIKNAPLEIQKWFVSGFFDADGCIRSTKDGRVEIAITQYDDSILRDIINVSSKINLKWRGPYNYKYKYPISSIAINKKKDVIRFLKSFPSLNPNKTKHRVNIWQKLEN